jgi:hypothetical protein
MSMTTGQAVVGVLPALIVGSDTNRATLMLSVSGASVFVGPDASVSPSTGFLLQAGAPPLNLPVTDLLWGCVAGDGNHATNAIVSWLAVGS